jgi:hypothetical protein
MSGAVTITRAARERGEAHPDLGVVHPFGLLAALGFARAHHHQPDVGCAGDDGGGAAGLAVGHVQARARRRLDLDHQGALVEGRQEVEAHAGGQAGGGGDEEEHAGAHAGGVTDDGGDGVFVAAPQGREQRAAALAGRGAGAEQGGGEHRGDGEAQRVPDQDGREHRERERPEDAARDPAEEEHGHEHPGDDEGGEQHRASHLERALEGRGDRVAGPLAEVAVDVLRVHDRGVDHDPHPHRDAAE